MSPAEIEVKIACARREMEHWGQVLQKKSCESCEHFWDSGCKLANGVKPPPEVQKTGCPEWRYDCIPF